MPIKVRVGQADAVKILSSAGGGSVEAFTSQNVIGGIASVTALDVTGISTFNGNIDATGISTFNGNVSIGSSILLESNGQASFTGFTTFQSSKFNDDVFIRNPVGNTIIFRNEGDAFFNGIVTATTFSGDLSGIATSARGLTGSPDIDVSKIVGTGLSISGITTLGNTDINGDLGLKKTISVQYSPTTAITPIVSARNDATLNNSFGGLRLQAHNVNAAAAIFDISVLNSSNNYKSTLVFQSRDGENSFSEKLRITEDGSVGIGTISPQGDLQVGTGVTVYGNTGIISAKTFSGNATTATLSIFSFMKNNSTTDETVFPVFVDGDGNQVAQELEIDSGFTYNPSTGILSATTFKGSLTGDVTGNVSGNAGTATSLANSRTIGGVSFDGTANIDLPGVNTTGDQNTTGTAGGLSGIPSITVQDITAETVSIGGTLSYEDVTNVDSVGIVTARAGVRISTGGLVVTSGVSTFSGIATFTQNVFVDGTLTAALIDGGVF